MPVPQTLVMGVLNVTPDSFSDGGQYLALDAAVTHAKAMAAAGAAIVDVGGESTRPGADRVDALEELRRVLPVVRALTDAGIAVSVDTMRATVAEACLEAGARIVNDVSGGRADPDLFAVVAQGDADLVIMHWRGHSATMQRRASYHDVVEDVAAEVAAQRDLAVAAGVRPERIILDPGLGFAKSWDHNWELLRHIDRFQALGHRVLVGASRKAFLGGLLDGRDPKDRDAATAAVSFWCAQHGVWAVRAHDVAAQADAIKVAGRLSPSDGRCPVR